MEITPIIDNIRRYVNLTADDEREFARIVQVTEIKKRDFVVKPGGVCHYQTYVAKGALRSYLIDDNGDEHTIQFAIEDWFISDFNSYIHRQPASLYVEAMEDSVLFQIGYQEVEELCTTNPVFERFFRLVAQKAFAYAQRRVLSNLGMTAEERYIEFNNMYPQIVRRMPQYALASYLGMSAEFLSKIRKRISKGA